MRLILISIMVSLILLTGCTQYVCPDGMTVKDSAQCKSKQEETKKENLLQEYTKPARSNRQCTYSSECANGGAPIAVDESHYVTNSCEDGFCVRSALLYTECTNNEACMNLYGQRYVCDLSRVNFGNCIKSTLPNF